MSPMEPEATMGNSAGDTPISAAEIQTALNSKQFSLRYQPKLDCETLGLKGFEALIRWDHPTRGLVLPVDFIPIAEDNGLIGAITEFVVDESFRWYVTTSGVPGLSLSINISAKRLSDLDFADWLKHKCGQSGIRFDAIILEISETAVLGERLHALDMFNRLRTKGFRVAIDGFGLGNSSLSLLARLPFTEVKIDKSFGIAAGQSAEARAFIKSTIQMSHSLGLSVVAEGIEDKPTLDYLRQLGCDFVHGFLVTQPLKAEETGDWILNRRKNIRHILV